MDPSVPPVPPTGTPPNIPPTDSGNPIETVPPETTVVPPSPTSSGTKPRISVAAIFGVLLLIGGIGAGLLLVQQSQIFKEKAGGIACDAGTCNDGFSYGSDCSAPQATCVQRATEACSSHGGVKSGGGPITCTNSGAPQGPGGTCVNSNNGSMLHLCPGTYSTTTYHCPNTSDPISGKCFCSSGHATSTDNGTIIVPSSATAGQDFPVSAPSCGSVQLDVNNGANVAGGGICAAAGSNCGGGSTSTGGGVSTSTTTTTTTTTTAPKLAICGEACNQDSDCARATGGGFQPVCYKIGGATTGICQNPLCAGYTTPGTICSCGATPSGIACGELCGGQNDGKVYPTNCINGVCGNNANGGTSGNRCLPWNAPGYVTKGGICVQDKNPAVYCINHSDGTPVLDEAGVRAACAAANTVTVGCDSPCNGTTAICSSGLTCMDNGSGTQVCRNPSLPNSSTCTPAPVCLSISKNVDSPQIGQAITFTCGTVVGATSYQFQYKVGTTVGTITSASTGSNLTQPFTITQADTYQVQCRPCVGNSCADWQTNWSPTTTSTTSSSSTTTTTTSTAPPAIIDANTAGLWHLDEPSGTGAYLVDSSGHGHNGTPTGTVFTPSGFLGGARFFTGQGNYVSFANVSVNTTAGGSNTVEFWMNWNGIPQGMPFGWSSPYDLTLYSANCFGFNTNNADIFGTTSTIPIGQWVHVAAVFPNGVPNAGNSKLYINGISQPLAYCVGSGSLSQSATSNFYLSGWGPRIGGAHEFSGTLDELKISNIARSAAEILADYQYGINNHH